MCARGKINSVCVNRNKEIHVTNRLSGLDNQNNQSNLL